LGVQKKQAISFNKLGGVFAGLLCFITLNALLILSKPVKTPHTVSSLTHLSSPFYFFTESDEEETKPEILPTEIQTIPVINHAQPQVADNKTKEENTNELSGLIEFAHTALTTSPFINVNFSQTVIPQLKDYQEGQVQEALEASKKVLEEQQWKAVENKIADVMTTHEKVLLKDQYEKALNKVDWDKMENNLRLAYDQIDWNKINDELSKAMVEIKMDSLQQVYTVAIAELSALKKELVQNNVQGIPDTDICLKSVEENKKNIQRAMNNLKKIRSRKIVHL